MGLVQQVTAIPTATGHFKRYHRAGVGRDWVHAQDLGDSERGVVSVLLDSWWLGGGGFSSKGNLAGQHHKACSNQRVEGFHVNYPCDANDSRLQSERIGRRLYERLGGSLLDPVSQRFVACSKLRVSVDEVGVYQVRNCNGLMMLGTPSRRVDRGVR